MAYLCKYKVHRVEVLQELRWWDDSDYDVNIATYLLTDLHLPKIKNVLFVAPESNGLS